MIKKYLNKILNAATAASPVKEAETMATTEVQPEMSADTNTAELKALLESATTTLAATQSKLTEMSVLYDTAKAALKEAEDAKASLATEVAQKRLAARKEKVVASVGTARADALLAATESLDDISFQAVVSAMAVSQETEANTEAFKEVGKQVAEVIPSASAQENEESGESKILKAKYQSNKGNK